MKPTARTVFIGGLQWLDYVHAGPRKSMSLVAEQKRRYLDPGRYAWSAYGPLLSAFRRSLNSVDRHGELDRVVARAEEKNDWRAEAYRDAVAGFSKAVPKRATGVQVGEATWAEGNLRIVFRHLLGVRLHDKNDTRWLVLPYCKGTALNQGSADIVLQMMETFTGLALPGATPVVLDSRHGKLYRLRANTNRENIDACVRGLAVAYERQWSLAA
ncbi:hypothetical protein SAXI111661_02850 [Saccharomonospora xinjiangensis]|uniref:hypothetical protein n=1 Tax=Saccharomonospora xinjiangensis TaxID=75294 RepID=UPI00106F55F8|nr:hypothetical protein [Saccharomonospora xinjiangensis]QBQ59898.1 hypothetical protein EYD13_07670 [Saccharomonospora xinjiangensis]